MAAGTQEDCRKLAEAALERAYCCNYGEGVASCALQMSGGDAFVGASVALEMGPLQPGAMSPLMVALVSLAAHGGCLEDIEQVHWVAGPVAQVEALRQADKDILALLAPRSSFRAV